MFIFRLNDSSVKSELSIAREVASLPMLNIIGDKNAENEKDISIAMIVTAR
jgi:hypothetical protein